MSQDPQQIREEIERTRSNLDGHLDELQDKVSPAAVVDRQKAAARQRVSDVKGRVMGSGADARESVSGAASGTAEKAQERIQGAPLAAGIAAFGLGMVVAALVPASRAESRAATQVKDVVQEHAQPLVDDVKAAAADLGQQVKDDATQAAQQVKQVGQDGVTRVQDEGTSAVEATRSEAQA